jgi:hypothetical protein
LTPDEATERLACSLWFKMEHLDPMTDIPDGKWGDFVWWRENVEVGEREYCRSCINSIQMDRDLWRVVLESK